MQFREENALVKLFKDLAIARGRDDVNVAFGAAVPAMERLKTVTIVALIVMSSLLGLAYWNLSHRMSVEEARMEQATLFFQARHEGIVTLFDEARRERHALMKALHVKPVSSS